uniref:Chromo domain-containing protein n=1 Tax=Meloidogyne javanica TaxID=6303 RepID=A0A915LIK8_MELJA
MTYSWEPRKGIAHLDKVLDRKIGRDGEIEYFIKWEGYDDDRNSWEPKSGVGHLKAIKDYDALNPMPDKKGSKRKSQDATDTPSTSKSAASLTNGSAKKSKKRRRHY